MSSISVTAGSARKLLYHSLFVQVLIALQPGIVLGMGVPDFAVGLKIFSDVFLKRFLGGEELVDATAG